MTAAARDEACAALYRLGDAGLSEMRKRASGLSPGRRRWMVAYAAANPGAQQNAWLLLFSQDADAGVGNAAREALQNAAGSVPRNAVSAMTGTGMSAAAVAGRPE